MPVGPSPAPAHGTPLPIPSFPPRPPAGPFRWLLLAGLLLGGAAGRVYEPALGRELPRLVPRGREFTLTDATWADPEQPNARVPVTAADVQSTVAKLKRRKVQPGAEAADLIEAVSARGTPQQF